MHLVPLYIYSTPNQTIFQATPFCWPEASFPEALAFLGSDPISKISFDNIPLPPICFHAQIKVPQTEILAPSIGYWPIILNNWTLKNIIKKFDTLSRWMLLVLSGYLARFWCCHDIFQCQQGKKLSRTRSGFTLFGSPWTCLLWSYQLLCTL